MYFVIGLPPSAGAVQLTVACPLPGEAVTPLGVLGGLGAAGAEVLKTRVAATHGVFAPVAVVGLGVVPAVDRTRSWARSSMSLVGETLVRTL